MEASQRKVNAVHDAVDVGTPGRAGVENTQYTALLPQHRRLSRVEEGSKIQLRKWRPTPTMWLKT